MSPFDYLRSMTKDRLLEGITRLETTLWAHILELEVRAERIRTKKERKKDCGDNKLL